ncbi:hypothetical protein MJ579_06255 [Klebsiella pneumoniae]|nr:hypothetical protein MJ579_06255 [Klebsiella pneumoniae]
MRQHHRRQADASVCGWGSRARINGTAALHRQGREAVSPRHQQQVGGADAAGGRSARLLVGELPLRSGAADKV